MNRITECLDRSTGEPRTNNLTAASGIGFGKQKSSAQKLKQFDFASNWESLVAPHLDDPDVVGALTLGMKFHQGEYNKGDAPWEWGSIPCSRKKLPREGSLEWYQPWNRCHAIAPFCWAIGQKIYPHLKWGFLSSRRHTVAVGWSRFWKQPKCVMDILQFQRWSAQESFDFVKEMDWKYHNSLARYTFSFYNYPRLNYWLIKQVKYARGIERRNEGVEFTEMLIDFLERAEMISKSPK